MKIYFTTDKKSCVIPVCDWDGSIEPDDEWRIGEITSSAYESHGIPVWKYTSDQIVARTQQEIQADIDALPVEEPSAQDILRADVDFLLMLAEE